MRTVGYGVIGLGFFGEKHAEVFDLVVNQGVAWKPLQPKNIARAGAVLTIDFDVPNPPLGEVKIVVETGPAPVPASSPGGPGGKPIKFEKIDIPAHYSDPEKTDLRYTVTPGQHRFDINLKADRP